MQERVVLTDAEGEGVGVDDVDEEGVWGVEADAGRHELEEGLGGVQARDPAQARHALAGVPCGEETVEGSEVYAWKVKVMSGLHIKRWILGRNKIACGT